MSTNYLQVTTPKAVESRLVYTKEKQEMFETVELQRIIIILT